MRGTARQRGPGKWQIQVYAGRDERTGRDIRVTRSVAAPHTRAGRKVVDQALAALIVEVETGRINLGEDPTLAELLDRWMAARSPEWSPKTVMENRRNIELKIRPKLGKMRVSKVRAMHLDALYAELRKGGGAKGQPLAPASVGKVHVILHAAFAQAIKWGLIASNPADAVTARSAPPSQITPPAPDALAGALGRIEELDPDFGMFVRLAATTGARRSQLCALRWSDVDLSGATIPFARGVVDGGPGVGLVEKPTKTGQIWKVALAAGTVIKAPRELCFDLSVDVDLHTQSTGAREEIDGGVRSRTERASIGARSWARAKRGHLLLQQLVDVLHVEEQVQWICW